MTAIDEVRVRDAATVMLVRDGDAGLEVFMLRRTLRAAFVGGFYVFPGGAVDEADRATDLSALSTGLTDAEASHRLGVPGGGLAFWVAAIRECFEEAGVLLACVRGDAPIRLDDPVVAAKYLAHRHAVHAGDVPFVDVCVVERLRLLTGAIHYVAHWITPLGEPRRFDTRFFLARAPEAQEPLHDDRETIASLWTRPAAALDRHHSGEVKLLPPTVKNLEFLASHATADAAMAAGARIDRPPTIEPRLVMRDGRLNILLPGDPGFEAAG